MNARARTRKRVHTSGTVVRSGAAWSAGGGACGEGARGEKRGRVGIIVVQITANDIDAPSESEWYATRYQRILSQQIISRPLRGPTARIEISQSFRRGTIFRFVTPKEQQGADVSFDRNFVPPARLPTLPLGYGARARRAGSDDALSQTPGTCGEDAAAFQSPLTAQHISAYILSNICQHKPTDAPPLPHKPTPLARPPHNPHQKQAICPKDDRYHRQKHNRLEARHPH